MLHRSHFCACEDCERDKENAEWEAAHQTRQIQTLTEQHDELQRRIDAMLAAAKER